MMKRRLFPLVAALAASQLLSACVPLVVGGAAVGGVMMYTDRRTSGAQVEDQSIEAKASSRVSELLGDRAHVNVTSYNRVVLLTGEVANDADRESIAREVRAVENVRDVINETEVRGKSSLASRSSDVLVTSKVKATLMDAPDVQGSAFKVVTERGVVYLMGRVTERELNRATELVRSIGGVEKVVRCAEVISEAELRDIQPPQMDSASSPAR